MASTVSFVRTFLQSGQTLMCVCEVSGLCRWRGGGGVGREVKDLTVLWFSDEYHHSRNCRKNTPIERLVERDTATPPTAVETRR